ncbi:hypothetical protein J6590_085656 [Homalodisca vitripennis]|nr:hypothetical protein J6590_085656 [Homalodisca vitripennis]
MALPATSHNVSARGRGGPVGGGKRGSSECLVKASFSYKLLIAIPTMALPATSHNVSATGRRLQVEFSTISVMDEGKRGSSECLVKASFSYKLLIAIPTMALPATSHNVSATGRGLKVEFSTISVMDEGKRGSSECLVKASFSYKLLIAIPTMALPATSHNVSATGRRLQVEFSTISVMDEGKRGSSECLVKASFSYKLLIAIPTMALPATSHNVSATGRGLKVEFSTISVMDEGKRGSSECLVKALFSYLYCIV